MRLPITSAGEAKECSIRESKTKERGIERHAAIAACAAPINDEKESQPKFNIILVTHMKTVAFAPGKTGHNVPVTSAISVVARSSARTKRLITPSKANSIISEQSSLRHLDVMIAMMEYCEVATKHKVQPQIVLPAI